jgi:hypothetical protein
VHRENVGMLERRGELDLAVKPLEANCGGEFRRQYLQRDVALVSEVAGEVDRGHAPAPELLLECVSVPQGFGQGWLGCGHVSASVGQPQCVAAGLRRPECLGYENEPSSSMLRGGGGRVAACLEGLRSGVVRGAHVWVGRRGDGLTAGWIRLSRRTEVALCVREGLEKIARGEG